MPIGNDIRAAGERLVAMQTQNPEEFAAALNGALNEFLPVTVPVKVTFVP